MGEQRNPGDSTSFLVPQVESPVAGWPIGSIGDYFGLPTVGQVSAGKRVTHSALPFRAYNLIFNEWFRDENLVTSFLVNTGDGPDPDASYSILNRGKRHDYFTSCLPWPQKGPSVVLPLGSSAYYRRWCCSSWCFKCACWWWYSVCWRSRCCYWSRYLAL